jgi:hypothetical protein
MVHSLLVEQLILLLLGLFKALQYYCNEKVEEDNVDKKKETVKQKIGRVCTTTAYWSVIIVYVILVSRVFFAFISL